MSTTFGNTAQSGSRHSLSIAKPLVVMLLGFALPMTSRPTWESHVNHHLDELRQRPWRTTEDCRSSQNDFGNAQGCPRGLGQSVRANSTPVPHRLFQPIPRPHTDQCRDDQEIRERSFKQGTLKPSADRQSRQFAAGNRARLITCDTDGDQKEFRGVGTCFTPRFLAFQN